MVRDSLMLNDENKRNIMRVLPSLQEHQTDELAELLSDETWLRDGMLQAAVETAVQNDDTSFLERINAYVDNASKGMMKEEERVDTTEDLEKLGKLESYFDDA